MGVCEDVVVPKEHQNNRSYVSSVDLRTFGFTMQNFSMVGGYTENLEKPQSCQNWGVGACMGVGACPDNTVYNPGRK